MQQAIILILTFITVIIKNAAIAQEIKIVSNADSSVLPYATVTNHTRLSIISSDQNGVARVVAVAGDTLLVSYVGYKTAVIRFNGKRIQIVSLLQTKKTLAAVTVHACRKHQEFSYNNFGEIKS